MERVKKMYLVDSVYPDLRNVKKHYSDLDRNVSEVLERRDIKDDEKLALYHQALNKYLINRRAVETELEEKPPKIRLETPKEKSVAEKYLDALQEGEERKKAERIIADVKAYTPLDWDEKGRLVHRGRVVEGSSLPEIVGHHIALAEKKKPKATKGPTGWETFEEYRSDIAPTPTPTRRSKRRRQRRFGLDWEFY